MKQKNQSKNSEIFEKPEINLKKEINNLKKKIFNIQLRTQANIENLKKDTQEKIKIIKKQKKEEIIINLIPIIDNFEKIENTLQKNKTKRNEKIVEGISLTLFNLKNNLKKIGLKSIKLQDKIFNPNFHETKEKLKLNKNNKYKIESIIKKGYIYNNKILRKLIVSISNSKKQ
ncbi:MAG: nucleotide exchange factor GrpE [Buchnera aphidicola (Tetraneura akinire)]